MDLFTNEDFEKDSDASQMLTNIDDLLVSGDRASFLLGIELIKGLGKLTISHFNMFLAIYCNIKALDMREEVKAILGNFINIREWKNSNFESKFSNSKYPLCCETYYSIWDNILDVNYFRVDSLPRNRSLRGLKIDLDKYKNLPKIIKFVKYVKELLLLSDNKIVINESIDTLSNFGYLTRLTIKSKRPTVLECNVLQKFKFVNLYLINIKFCKFSIIPLPEINNLVWTIHLNIEINLEIFPNLSSLVIHNFTSERMKIPNTIKESLESLRVVSNKNSEVRFPSEIFSFKNLKSLFLANFKIKVISERVAALEKLQTIQIYDCQVENFPTHFSKLPNLHNLRLENNLIREVPSSCLLFPKLTYLSLNQNKLERIPEVLGKFEELNDLELQENKIKTLNLNKDDFPKLTNLRLEKNEISHLPEIEENLPSLKSLHLRYNKLQTVPFCYFRRFSDCLSCTFGNEINSLPPIPEDYQPSVEEKGIFNIYSKIHISNFVKQEYLKVFKDRIHFNIDRGPNYKAKKLMYK